MKFQFPHFSHRIPSRIFFSLELPLLWFGLTALIVINILSLQKGRPIYWNKLMMLFETPLSAPRHVDLATLLWQLGNKREARDVLGATTTSAGTLAKWEQEENKIVEQYIFWQSVAVSKPDYRDAYIQLAYLAYQREKFAEARAWLAKAVTLDPNSISVQKLRELLR